MNEYIDFEVARKYLHEACAGLGSNGGLMLKIKFDQEPKADVVSKEKYDELNDRYHRLLESANILSDAVHEYERREDAN